MSRVTIVGLGGSLARQSASLSALRVALDGARDYGAEVQLFDASGSLVCEDRLGRYDAIVVPRSASRLRARADDGRTADVALVQVMVAAELSVPVELK